MVLPLPTVRFFLYFIVFLLKFFFLPPFLPHEVLPLPPILFFLFLISSSNSSSSASFSSTYRSSSSFCPSYSSFLPPAVLPLPLFHPHMVLPLTPFLIFLFLLFFLLKYFFYLFFSSYDSFSSWFSVYPVPHVLPPKIFVLSLFLPLIILPLPDFLFSCSSFSAF